jgi:transcriptional regulator with XRE-family HTH domain
MPVNTSSLTANSGDARPTPRLTREMVACVQPTIAPTAASVRPWDDIHVCKSLITGDIRGAYIYSQANYTHGDVARLSAIMHHAYMAKQKHYLREWREFRGKTQEQVAEQIEILAHDPRFMDADKPAKVAKTQATLQRVETGKLPYSQVLLEILSEIYSTDPGSLIMRNPLDANAPHSILDGLPKPQLDAVVTLIETFKRQAS